MKPTLNSILAGLLLLHSCGDPDPRLANIETVNSGTATLLCDSEILPLIESVKPIYDTAFPGAKITLQPVDARAAMVQLLSGKTRGIIVARDYLRDEDSAMQLHNIAKHQRFLFAIDGIVLFTMSEFPLDTLSKEQIVEAVNSREPTLAQRFPALKTEPVFVTLRSGSSLYGNIMNQICGGSVPKRPMKFFSTQDSVATYVRQTKGAIGIGYLSKFGRDTSVKLLKLGFTDTTGKRIYPQTVHPGFVVREMYPFPVHYYGYLLEDKMNLPWGFFTYMRTDNRIQQTFLDAGIVPAFAKLELIEQEQ